MESATITLTNILDGDAESLTVGTLPAGITASAYDPATGTITLTGDAPIADYQAAIAGITYNNTATLPNQADRVIDVSVNDGEKDSNVAVSTITFGDAPPVIDLDADDSSGVAGNDYTNNFVPGAAPVTIGDIDTDITDVDDANMQSATITLTNILDGDAESLTVGTLPAGITASAYDPATGTITLTGDAPIADYQAAIAGITYNNTSGTPNQADRVIDVKVNDGEKDSNVAVSTITFGDAPLRHRPRRDDSSGVAGNDYTNNFVPGAAPVTIGDIDTDITDVDDANMQSATITLTNILDGDAESLTVGTLPAGITASAYDPATGTITLTGDAPIADYQAAIAGITYNNTSGTPNQADRVIDVKVNDGEKDSNVAVSTITFGDAPPVIDLDGDDSSGVAGNDYTNNFVPGATPVTIGDIDTDITDVDDANMQSATITLTNILDGAAESLTVGTLPAGITASAYDPATGTITLTGDAPIADYQAAIAGITYNNTATLPNQADRVIDVSVNDGEKDSNVAVSTITFGDAPPVIDLDGDDSSGVAGNDYTNNFVPGAAPVTIGDIDTDITDVDDANMQSATITLTNILDGAAESLTVGTLPAGITASAYDPATGTITLTGDAPIADYQAAIAGITYNNTSGTPNQADRVIDVKVNDGEKDSNVAVSTITFGDAPPVIDLDGDDSSGVAGNDYTNNFVPGAAPVTIGDIDTDITDVDDANMQSATITLTNILDGAAESLTVGTLPRRYHCQRLRPRHWYYHPNGRCPHCGLSSRHCRHHL